MKNYRIPRLQSELKKLFNTALSQKLNDPKLAWVQITDVVISKDLHYAKYIFLITIIPPVMNRSGNS